MQQFTDIISTHLCCIPTDWKLYNIFHVIVVYKTVQIGERYIQTYKKGNFEQDNIDAITVQ